MRGIGALLGGIGAALLQPQGLLQVGLLLPKLGQRRAEHVAALPGALQLADLRANADQLVFGRAVAADALEVIKRLELFGCWFDGKAFLVSPILLNHCSKFKSKFTSILDLIIIFVLL